MISCVVLVYPSLLLLLVLSLPAETVASSPANRVLQKSAQCDEHFVYFSLTFERPFRGLIYSDTAIGQGRCIYANGTIFSSTNFNLTVPLDDCRSGTIDNGTRTNTVTVQYDPRILEATDTQYMLMCVPSGGGINTGRSGDDPQSDLQNGNGEFSIDDSFTVTFASIDVQATLGSTEVVTNAAATGTVKSGDYTVEVLLGDSPNGSPVDRILNIGESISYVVNVKALPVEFDTKIGRCWATDEQSSIQLSNDDGCSLQRGGNVWNNFQNTTRPDGSRVYYNSIKAWAFPSSTRVNIFCNLHLKRGQWPPQDCSQLSSLSPAAATARQFEDRRVPDASAAAAALNSFLSGGDFKFHRQNRQANVNDPPPLPLFEFYNQILAVTTDADSSMTTGPKPPKLDHEVIALKGGFQVQSGLVKPEQLTAAENRKIGQQVAAGDQKLGQAAATQNQKLGSQQTAASDQHPPESFCIPKSPFIIAVVLCAVFLVVVGCAAVALLIAKQRRRRSNVVYNQDSLRYVGSGAALGCATQASNWSALYSSCNATVWPGTLEQRRNALLTT